MVMKIVFLLIYFVSTGIHLYASKKKIQKLRDVTKPFILTSLLGFYCVMAKPIMATMVLALIFSWLGDVFLIGRGVKWFTVGGICFMISHIFFVLAYNTQVDFSKINIVLAVVIALLYATATVIEFKNLKEWLPKALFYPMFFYLLINSTMNCFAFYRMLSNPCLPTVITFIGALMFYISDCTLFFVRFKKDGKDRDHFLVMLTYSLGELLIVLGMI